MPTLADKLHPNRFPGMSGRMAAIVGYILGEEWSRPRIAELVVTSDGWLLARTWGMSASTPLSARWQTWNGTGTTSCVQRT